MVNEVNKLIYNTLIKYHALHLPDVGTISVVRHSAVLSSKKELLPPRFAVEYSLDNNAKSLIDIISKDIDVDQARAEEIYSRWLDKAREGSVVVIDRVGTLRDKRFTANREFVDALNGYSQPLRVTHRKSYAPLYIVLAIMFIGALGYGCWWYMNWKSADDIVVEDEIILPVEKPLVVDIENPEIEIVDEVNDTTDIVEEPEVVKEVVSDWRTRDDIRHRVVVGSYSTIENAERAISDIVKRLPYIQCDCFMLGSMYAVAVFGSSDMEECQEFKRTHTKEFAQSWVHTPKKFR